MSHYLIRQIRDTGNIQVRPNTSLVGASGTDHLERSASATPATGRSRRPWVRATCSCSSARPPAPNGSTGWSNATARGSSSPAPTCSPAAGGHGAGLPTATYYLEPACLGVFAAGDARANSVKRVASAVGEGAMAIQLVHGYLEACW